MKILKSAGWLVLVFLVGIGGVLVGGRMRDRVSPEQAPVLPAELARHRLPVGEPFPDVPLRDAAGHTRSSADLAKGGSVVLFLDLDCTPCTDLVLRWQDALEAGAVEPGRVWGVSHYPRAAIDDYVRELGLTLPVYSDSLRVFHDEYRVEYFPLAVTVGGSGLVRGISYDSVSPINFTELAEKLGR